MVRTTVAVRDRELLVAGEWVDTGSWLDVVSPYSGELVGRAAQGNGALVRAAVDAAAARSAEPLPAHERAAVLDRVAAALAERRDEAAQLVCAEAGKPMKAARVEADRAVSTFTFAGVAARTLAGELVPMDASPAGAGKLAFTLRVPVGVVGAISPFNFPLNLVAHKLAPAIAAGCPVIVKPASKTPLSALFLAELLVDAGLPAGLLAVVPGPSSEIGDVFVEDSRVRLITFTGSAPVGWKLRERAARKRVTLELGNATPAIVLADADVESAATKLAASAFGFAGQSCIAVQRVFVSREILSLYTDAFVSASERLVVGDPADEQTDVGPVISSSDRDRILEWIEESAGDVLTGGRLTDDGLIPPTVIASPPPTAKVACKEVFGPVATVTPVDSLEDAVAAANATPFGLQAGIFTRDVTAALRAAHALEFGGVTINETPTFRADQMPYGGVKDSGNTREGPAWAVRELTEERLVVLNF
jgi:acyl-CoA reductase-like NAD-dependent aldehyde dehydrogenase